MTGYAYLKGFIEALGLTNITLVEQDWGSGLGFHYANQHRDRIKGIVFMEAMHGEIDFAAMARSDKMLMRLIRAPFAQLVDAWRDEQFRETHAARLGLSAI